MSAQRLVSSNSSSVFLQLIFHLFTQASNNQVEVLLVLKNKIVIYATMLSVGLKLIYQHIYLAEFVRVFLLWVQSVFYWHQSILCHLSCQLNIANLRRKLNFRLQMIVQDLKCVVGIHMYLVPFIQINQK